MYKNNTLENLELKLARTKQEQAEKAKEAENSFAENYKALFEYVFEKDTLGFKRFIGAYFILDAVDGKSQNEALQSALSKTLQQIPLQPDKKDLLLTSLKKLDQKKEFITENLSIQTTITKDPNYPIIESLIEQGLINNADLAEIALRYKNGDNIIEATHFLSESKREIITRHFYELNDTKTEDRIKNFETDFKEEIESSPQIQKFPRVVQFLGRYYTKLKLKNKTESKKDRLKRMFKIAFLKLYRLKFSGIDIDTIIEKINGYGDFEEYISLLLKYFEVLKQNPDLAEAYTVLDEIDVAENVINEAEGNKEKEIQSDKNILEATKIIEEIEEGLSQSDVEELLGEDVSLVGDEFHKKEEHAGVLADSQKENTVAEDQEDQKYVTQSDLEAEFEDLREELFELEDKKRKCFLEGEYDEIDEINNELIALGKKADKLKKLLGIGIDDEYQGD